MTNLAFCAGDRVCACPVSRSPGARSGCSAGAARQHVPGVTRASQARRRVGRLPRSLAAHIPPRPAKQQRRSSSPSPNTQITILWMLRTPVASLQLSAAPSLLIRSILTIDSRSHRRAAAMAASCGSPFSPRPRCAAAAAPFLRPGSCLMRGRGSDTSPVQHQPPGVDFSRGNQSELLKLITISISNAADSICCHFI